MKPVSPVIPNKNYDEVAVAERQDEYQTLPAITLENGIILCRWHMTEEERRIVAETGDVYLLQWTGGTGVTPMLLQVEAPILDVPQPEPEPLPQMMTAVRRSAHIVNEAKRHGFEIFEDNCTQCTCVVVYTAATKETLLQSPDIKIFCTVCFKTMQVESPQLEGVYLLNTQEEMKQIASVSEKTFN